MRQPAERVLVCGLLMFAWHFPWHLPQDESKWQVMKLLRQNSSVWPQSPGQPSNCTSCWVSSDASLDNSVFPDCHIWSSFKLEDNLGQCYIWGDRGDLNSEPIYGICRSPQTLHTVRMSVKTKYASGSLVTPGIGRTHWCHQMFRCCSTDSTQSLWLFFRWKCIFLHSLTYSEAEKLGDFLWNEHFSSHVLKSPQLRPWHRQRFPVDRRVVWLQVRYLMVSGCMTLVDVWILGKEWE